MKLGINTYPYLWNCELADSFQKIADMGVKDVEILTSVPHIHAKSIRAEEKARILQAALKAGVKIMAFNPPGLDINLASVNPDMRAYTVDHYQQWISLASEWDVPYLVMPPGKLHPLLPPDFEWVWKQCKGDFERLVEFAEQRKVTLLVENIPSLFLQTSEEVGWVLNELPSPYFAAIYDVANGYMVEDPAVGIRRLGDYIKLVHLSDTTHSKWEHAVIGSGDVPFEKVQQALQGINYKGICMLEIIHPEAEVGIGKSIDNLQGRGWEFHG
ncbi:sugar phosphate isomerase/epimerase family protein [Ammoniphilus resinae]|uniref:Sugar phosphate isomerase/epimerase n=1 Tax=Ammoniphilus resinae TaxID=861532 RepID=A0ABS4GWS8_9BACL|nr:sugar phosphate isomerase/epimerase family protein [Ammoniphilus resinae]MBP1934557.1 sugar phosphate isomerase/epimerase [Ammoniphilus resinae]